MHRVSVAEYLQALAALVAAGQFIRLRLAKLQPALFAYLVFQFIFLSALGALDARSSFYFYVYLSATALLSLVSILAVRETFTLTFERYPGIRSAGRRVVYGATAAAALLSLGVTAFFNRGAAAPSSDLYFVEILYRSVILTLSVVAIALLIALVHYPLQLSRNTYVSTLFFSAILFSEAIQLLFDSINGVYYVQWMDIVQVGFSIACFLGWAFMLRPQEAFAPAARVVFNNPHEEDLLRQLESLNTLLTRAGRQ